MFFVRWKRKVFSGTDILIRAPLAQLDRVAHYECEGRRFESYMARQEKR